MLRGSNTGLFLGICYYDTYTAYKEDLPKLGSLPLCTASQVSYAMDFKGPVAQIDTACASSFSAFLQAILSLKSGECDRCIVAGLAIHLRPTISYAFHSLKMLSDDGTSKCLDADANGYCRSESVICVLLEKESIANRVYARIVNCQTNCDGYKQEGITFPKYDNQYQLMKDVYKQAKINPLELDYIEAHMTGTPAGDPIESRAILSVLRPNYERPILFGCLKSNMGHTEGASALASISKVVKIFQTGLIPANLNYHKPNPFIAGLEKNIIIPVLETTSFCGNLIGVNSFGFGGANVHSILQKYEKSVTDESFILNNNQQLPRIINVCNRTVEGINYTFDFLLSNPNVLTREFLGLLNNVSKISPKQGMKFRGYLLINDMQILNKVHRRVDKERPLWLVFSHLERPWPQMSLNLFKFAAFCARIKSLSKVLQPFNIDLESLLTNGQETFENDIVAACVSVIAVQIGIVDIIRYLEIDAVGYIGQSIGEVAVGYADDCLSAEQAILIAYWIGVFTKQVQQVNGLMMSLSLSWQEAKKINTDCVTLAFNNSKFNTIVSGSEEAVQNVIHDLNAQGIVSQKVDTCGAAFHSLCIKGIYNLLLQKLKTIIIEPKKRSSKWLSTFNQSSEYLSSEYIASMITKPVYFAQALSSVSINAVILEIGHNSFLSEDTRNVLGKNVVNITTVNHQSKDSLASSLNWIGQLYLNGYNPKVEKLYPKVQYPVPRETATLSHLINWDHSKSWLVTKFPKYFTNVSANMRYTIDIQNKSYKFLLGHAINEKILLPATFYLMTVWRKIALSYGSPDYAKIPIEFRNVKFHQAIMLSHNDTLKFDVLLNNQTKTFTVTEKGLVCVTGYAHMPTDFNLMNPQTINCETSSDSLKLTSKEVYKELRLRGYDYGKSFQGVVEAMSDGSKGKVKFLNDWVSFADSCFQIILLGNEKRQLFLPIFIEYLRCDPLILFSAIEDAKKELGEPILDVYYDKVAQLGGTNGLFIKGVSGRAVERRQNFQNVLLENCHFVGYHEAWDIHCDKQTQEYIYLCLECMKVIQGLSKVLEDAIEDKIRKYLSKNGEKHVLMKTLFETLKPPKEAEKEAVKETNLVKLKSEEKCLKDILIENIAKYKKELSKDLIVSPTYEGAFRHQVEVAAENMLIKTAAITEMNCTYSFFFDRASEWMIAHNIRSRITVLHPDESVESTKLTSANFVRWDINDYKELPSIDKSDLFIYKDYQTSLILDQDTINRQADLNKVLAFAFESLLEERFMICCFRNQLSLLEERLIQFLNHPQVSFTDMTLFKQLAEEVGFIVIDEKFVRDENSDLKWTFLLLKKPLPSQILRQNEVIISVDSRSYEWVIKMKKAMKDEKMKRIWLMATASPLNGVLGMIRCLRKEPRGEVFRCIYNAGDNEGQSYSLTNEIIKKDLVMNVFKNNQHGSYRYSVIDNFEEQVTKAKHVYLDVKVKGDLSSFRWFQARQDSWKTLPNKISQRELKLVHVYYSALNFKDIMMASGRIPPNAYPLSHMDNCSIGFEYSGIDLKGQRIFGLCDNQAIATSLLITGSSNDFQWKVPDKWTLAEAATVSVCYVTAYYALFIRGKLRPGESVLIHAGSGGVGQAAISVCLSRGCEVFTTVGSKEKREFIKTKFPKIDDNHICSSRSTDFEEKILKMTNGRGVDVILNSLAEEKLQASLRCLTDFGRFLEIGKYDIIENNPLGWSLQLNMIATLSN